MNGLERNEGTEWAEIRTCHWPEVPRLVRDLIANTQVEYVQSAKAPAALDELAVRFHHELVRIHPWPNGNGRHGRLATDVLLRSWGRPPFSWGGPAQCGVASACTLIHQRRRSATASPGYRSERPTD